MIICQCTQLTSAALQHALTRAQKQHPNHPITPKAVLHEAGVTLACGGCWPLLMAEMARASALPPDLGGGSADARSTQA